MVMVADSMPQLKSIWHASTLSDSAKALDAGTTKSGRPFFIMELVKGIPITKYCDQEHLTPKE